MPEKFDKETLACELKNAGFCGGLFWFDECQSTNTEAARLLDGGAGAPFAAVARSQSAGRGRLSRKWVSEPDSSLCISFALDLPDRPELLQSFTVRAALEICDALEKKFGAKILIKWPNDIYSPGGEKIAGMLTELKIGAGGKKTAVLGIGVNCFPLKNAGEGSSDFAAPIGDLQSACEREISAAKVAACLAAAALVASRQTSVAGVGERFARLDWLFGREIQVDAGGEKFFGKASGVADTGELIIKCAGGEKKCVAALEATVSKK
ncbi:MAG: biotin--[Opitutales bacterium]|nr:biotin--[acetyl-CoA-carboxylase] ligase [Opitutales bacterium]